MKYLCVCGHHAEAHEDADGGTHECQLCGCLQFFDVQDAHERGLIGCQTPPLGVRIENP